MELKLERIKELIEQLNMACNDYYNKHNPTLSDYEFDVLYSELTELEQETNIVYSNSPTQKVGYEVKSELCEVAHNHPMLSLDKCHNESDLIKFASDNDCILSVKCDGLSVSLRYLEGELVSAETRGNGVSGNDVLHNALVINNIPKSISYPGELIIDGEVVINYNSFSKINELLSEDEKYKHPRNLASASLTLLDSSIAAKRKMEFIAWRVIKGFEDTQFSDSNFFKLKGLEKLGFDIVPMWTYTNKSSDKDSITDMLENLKDRADNMGLPMDGAVMSIDSISYGNSLGSTGKFPRHSIAYKFEDELFETVLENIEWNTSKTGLVNPIAIYRPVDLSGAITTKATLHNISYIKGLQLGIGDTILVRRANGVIPKVHDNLTRSNNFTIPTSCPVCGYGVELHNDNGSETLYCTNDNCSGKLLGRLTHFVSKNAINIDGLSEETLDKFVKLGWLNTFSDIYTLPMRKEIANLEGFGKKSFEKLCKSIEKSKNTTLERLIYSLSIPNVGKDASKKISNKCKGEYETFVYFIKTEFNWNELEGIGEVINQSIHNYFASSDNKLNFVRLKECLIIESPISVENNNTNILNGAAICITGKLIHYTNRDALVTDIIANGGKEASGVTVKTSYLLTNDKTSGSSKNQNAQKLGIPIISEEEFMKMIGK